MTRPDLYRVLVAGDVLLFADTGTRPRVLLIERRNPPYQGCWAFPGGLLDEGESVPACAARELAEETGVTGVALDELGTWSEPDRDERGRIISVAFTGVATAEQAATARAGDDAASFRWAFLDELDPATLAFDHAEMLAKARAKLGI